MNRIAISSAAHAAALVAVGFPRQGLRIEALHNTGTGERRIAWHLECANASDASDLMRRVRENSKNPLWRENPAHPLLAALTGAFNHETLAALRLAPHEGLSGTLQPGKKLLRIHTGTKPTGEDFLRQVVVQYQHQSPELPLVAALVAVGFVPRPMPTGAGAIVLPTESVLYPELGILDALEAAKQLREPKVTAPMQLPGPFAPGMHPFQFAFAAAWNLASTPDIIRAAGEQPTHFFRQHKSAMANDAALNRPGFEQKIKRHIAGLPV